MSKAGAVFGMIGLLLVLVGTVWTLQGAGVLPGSFMSNDTRWLVIGLVTAVLGAALSYRGFRPR